MDHRNIRPEQLLFWHAEVAGELKACRPLGLQKWLRFEEAPYLQGQLDKLISDARRSRAEYGFSQLRLVLAFLRWNNLKEAPQERIHSPLLLMPVELVKRKGIKDHYTLVPQGTEVEVNPALRHHLKQLYDLELPAMIDLRDTTVEAFHQALQELIRASEPGVTLALGDKPKIHLIHEHASQRLDQYRRRMARAGRSVPRPGNLAYSYDRADFRPLGLQMFQKLVLPSPLPLRGEAGAPPPARTPFLLAPNAERKMFALVEEAQGNPYAWEFDLCALTLANFNYRKMTLVRDYANLIENDLASVAFDRVFSIEPKAAQDAAPASLAQADQHLIIAADATQIGAIARARLGDSLIIQGPPGTGKSQTITNLIADYVARGKRVLFVCEKRAAIDVVFHRLRQQGLDELCCLIHDSQSDKKEFILNLKHTYEDWLAAAGRSDADSAKHAAALRIMETELASLDTYLRQMLAVPAQAGLPLRDLLLRLIELRGETGSGLSAEAEARLPDYAEWLAHGETVTRLAEALADLGAAPVFAQHPLRWLGEPVITSETPLEGLAERLDRAERELDDLYDALQQTGISLEHRDSLGEVSQLLAFAERLLPLAQRALLGLLQPGSDAAAALASACKAQTKLEKHLAAAQAKTIHWRDKLTPQDAATALTSAPRLQGVFGFVSPAWWRLRKVLRARYDFSQHAVVPSWEQILGELVAEHAADAALAGHRAQWLAEFAADDPRKLAGDLHALGDPGAPAPVVALRAGVVSSDTAGKLVADLSGLGQRFERLREELDELVFHAGRLSLAGLAAAVREIREEGDALPELLPLLRELAAAPEKTRRCVREMPLTATQLEAACAQKSLNELYRGDRMLQRFDSHLLEQKLSRLRQAHHQWLEHNAGWIRSQVRHRFIEHVQLASQSATVLTAEQKAFKKIYTAGRRELEHEFGKTMRYKSIRDLAADDSGVVLRDLKPIWLMSPLSVSDTLPLDTGLFDVVIFDEASQIPVEDAVPAAYRAQQVIVVGDEMQLPPTTFFSSSGDSEDELNIEEEGEAVRVMMDADSFLTQCARNLPSTLLAWHYRSRYEALISFSNAAFYGGELYTIPDRQLPGQGGSEHLINDVEEADAMVAAVLAKPVSFIRCSRAPYENRRNPTEAAVIARMVRGILLAETKLSIGVAAFSEAQQGEIESALEALAAVDPDFAIRLEAEYVREEDDQFCGLFVKNLENVQGDERDIILMSVCYGPDAAGKMRMNFGPINQRGGEKRLNVIFSRARQHMVLVSSIRHTQITNDYNDGARALKNFLQYAESLSRGEPALARQVLDGLNPLKRKSMAATPAVGGVAQQVAAALQQRGWLTETGAGQSRFRCDVAVRPANTDRHQLAILIDGGAQTGALERFHTRPEILRAFGWQVAVVTAKDWWHEPDSLIERIERLLRREEVPEQLAPPEADVAAPEEEPAPAMPTAHQATEHAAGKWFPEAGLLG